jgi:hypothetical protein
VDVGVAAGDGEAVEDGIAGYTRVGNDVVAVVGAVAGCADVAVEDSEVGGPVAFVALGLCTVKAAVNAG